MPPKAAKTKKTLTWRELDNNLSPKNVMNMLPNYLIKHVKDTSKGLKIRVVINGDLNKEFVQFITEGWGSQLINFGGFGDIDDVSKKIKTDKFKRIGKTLLAYKEDTKNIMVKLYLPFFSSRFSSFAKTFAEKNLAGLANLTFGEDDNQNSIPQYIHYKDFSDEAANDLVIQRLKDDFGTDCKSEKIVICIYKLPGTTPDAKLSARAPRVQKVETSKVSKPIKNVMAARTNPVQKVKTSANIGVKTPTAAKPPVERIAAVVKFELAEAKVKKTGEFGLARQIAEDLPKKHALRKAVMNLDKSSTKREIKNALMIFDSTDPEKVYKELKFANDLKPKYNAEVVKQYPDKVMKKLDKMANEKHNSRAYNVH